MNEGAARVMIRIGQGLLAFGAFLVIWSILDERTHGSAWTLRSGLFIVAGFTVLFIASIYIDRPGFRPGKKIRGPRRPKG